MKGCIVMPEQEKNLEQLNAVRKAVSQSLGLTLTDEVIAGVLEGNSLSLDQLSENQNLTEIGTALIRLDGLSKMFPANKESSKIKVCVKTPLGEVCWEIQQPPRED
ncbi:hypothetical protein NDI49_05400 [Trichocoleus sp. ST-U3]